MGSLMDDLARWLGECLDEDERIARAATPGPWEQAPERVGWLASDEYWSVVDCSGTPAARENAEHVAVWDPARVLREIDTKRQLVAVHHAKFIEVINADGDERAGHFCFECDEPFPCRTLRLIALPYADRDGYQEFWRP